MKRIAAFILLAIFSVSPIVGYARTSAWPESRSSRKAEKKQQKAMKKYAKAQRKAQRKMAKQGRNNYPASR